MKNVMQHIWVVVVLGTFVPVLSHAQQPIGPSGEVSRNFVRVTYYQKPILTVSPASSFNTDDVIRDLMYLDGFGRPVQQIGIKASFNYKDIVTPITYDAYGRRDRSYLPYATATGAGGGFKANAVTNQASYFNAPPADVVQIPVASGITPSFSQTVMERSPSSRVTQQGFEGAVWQPAASRTTTAGRTMVAEQALNNTTAYTTTASTRRVARYEVTLDVWGAPTLVLVGTFAAGALHVEITKGENWTSTDGRNGTTEQYMDKQGRVLLSRTFNLKGATQEMLSTYYVYDNYGNLTYMLPPELNPDRDGTTAPTVTELNNFAFQYIYDEYNRMVLRRLPGKGWENTIYNPMDWVIFHQDARQETETIPGFTPGQYHTFHKYDSQGRLVIKGIERNRVWDRISIQNAIKTQTYQWEVRKTGAGTMEGYTNQAIPTNAVDMDVQEVYYYDDYSNIPGLPDNKSSSHSKLVHGKLVASKVKVLGTTSFLWTVYYYNDKGELVNKYEQHYQAAKANAFNYDRYQQTYYFNGLPNTTTRNHYLSNSSNTDSLFQVKVQNTFTFDHRNRESLNYNSVNSATPTIISGKSYNEIGQLTTMNLHSTTTTSWGQQIGYRYNARGWLTQISSPLFTQQLKYNDGATPQYNGNVADQVFTRKNTASTPVNVTDTYNYTYDHLNRMLQGQMAAGKGRETLVYDKGGNITSLTRTNAAAAIVDQLTYTYASGRLSSIADANASTDAHFQLPGTTTYTYDINGNMKSRINSGSPGNNIISIIYNQLNLPSSITVLSGTTSYVYDAYGRKLRSVGAVGGTGVLREYINGIEYIGDVLSTIDHAQGRIVKTGSTYSYDYTIRDHLGNNRSGFPQGINATIPNFSADYYPFGLRYLQYERPGTPANYYLYNSNEWQTAAKQYDFNARFYDPVIGRFAQVDPLADMFGQQSVSPYSAFWNSPVTFQDKWGLAAGDSPTWWRRLRDFFKPVRHIILDEVYIPNPGPQKRPSDKDSGSGSGGAGGGFRWGGSMIDYSGFYGQNGGGGGDGGGGGGDGGGGGNSDGGNGGGKDVYDLFNKTVGFVGAYNDIKGNITHNDLYWKGKTTGKTYYKNPFSKASGWKANSFKASGKAFQASKSLGSKLGAAGVLLSVGDMTVNGVNTSNSLDLVFGAAGFIPGIGWVISGTYFIGNIATEMTTGKNIGQHIDDF